MKTLLVLGLIMLVTLAAVAPLNHPVAAASQPIPDVHLAAVRGGELSFACGFTIAIAVGGLVTGNYFLAMHGLYGAYYYCNS
jgi:hypothetical protein